MQLNSYNKYSSQLTNQKKIHLQKKHHHKLCHQCLVPPYGLYELCKPKLSLYHRKNLGLEMPIENCHR